MSNALHARVLARTCAEAPLRTEARDGPGSHVPLWLCAYLPDLALEVSSLPGDRPSVVVDESGGRPMLHAVSAQAASYGLVPGMPLSAAGMLCPALCTAVRDLVREQNAMRALAERALTFTPWVSLDFPGALLLEIRGSLNLFGGLDALIGQVRDSLAALGHRACCAATPAPFASWLLALGRREANVELIEALRSALGDLPGALLGCAGSTHQRLAKAGLTTLRELWRMPRDGLARRYGMDLLKRLDQAAGERPMPLRRFCSVPTFRSSFELAEEAVQLAHFFPAVAVLIGRLAEFLAQHGATTTRIRLALHHRDRPPTQIRQGFRLPAHEAGRLSEVLHERLDRLAVPAPVRAIDLCTESVVPRVMASIDLFAEHDADAAGWQQLLDQLQARLGQGGLSHLRFAADHRPERAGAEGARPLAAEFVTGIRPLWLLPRPRPLAHSEVGSIDRQAERIRSGWWDGGAIDRDYHIVVDKRGARLWVYRDRQSSGRWYVHGLFG